MPWGGTFKNIPGDAVVKVEVRKGHPCICPNWPEPCSWLDCLTECVPCTREKAS